MERKTSSTDGAPLNQTQAATEGTDKSTGPASKPTAMQVSTARVRPEIIETSVKDLTSQSDQQSEFNITDQAKGVKTQEVIETKNTLATELLEKVNCEQSAQPNDVIIENNTPKDKSEVITTDTRREKEKSTDGQEKEQENIAVVPKVEITEDSAKAAREDPKKPPNKRPQRKNVKRKVYAVSESESEEETVVKIEIKDEVMDKNRLNCVMCESHFTDLVDLESHVRGHDEVLHFSLVLKTPVSVI